MELQYSKQMKQVLEKCLRVQKASYGLYHSSVLQTLQALADNYFRLEEREESTKTYQMCLEIQERIKRVNPVFTILAKVRICSHEVQTKKILWKQAQEYLEELRRQVEQIKEISFQDKQNLNITINNIVKDAAYQAKEYDVSLQYLKKQCEVLGDSEILHSHAMCNFLQDIALINYELKRYEDSIKASE